MWVYAHRDSVMAHNTPALYKDGSCISLLKQPANHTNYGFQLALW